MGKSKKAPKKHTKLLIVLGLGIIIIILALVCIVLLKNDDEETEEENIEVDYEQLETDMEDYVSDKTIPRGIAKFSTEYEGDIDRTTIYEKLYTVSRYLPDLATWLKETDDYESYYEENSANLKKYLGIDNSDDFVELANYLIENDISEDELSYCTYEEGTITNYSDYSTFDMTFTFENFGDIKFSVKLSNKTVSGVSVLEILAPNE